MRAMALFIGVLMSTAASANVVTDWNEMTLQTIRDTATNPPKATRVLAMVHVAMFDALVGIQGGYEPYHVTDAAPPGASGTAAAAAAAHRVLTSLFPTRADIYDAALADSLGKVRDGDGEHAGADWGVQVADAILALRAADHSADVVAYTPGDSADEWQPTPPAFASALLPNWPIVTCWVMSSGQQFRSSGPPAVTSQRFADAFKAVKELGSKTSATRTADQTEIAKFWSDGGGTETPPGHWNAIAQGLVDSQGLSELESARLFALLNLAEADAAICSWDNKYAYNHVRPLTAIRNADSDGNDDTAADPAWEPLIATPPFPSYTSGHSTFSGAAARVLALFFGGDDAAFTSDSDGLPGVSRSFDSFSAAAKEAADSRLYGGIHYDYDNADGLAGGSDIGTYVYENALQPTAPELAPFFQCGPLGLASLSAMLLPLIAAKGRRSRLGH